MPSYMVLGLFCIWTDIRLYRAEVLDFMLLWVDNRVKGDQKRPTSWCSHSTADRRFCVLTTMMATKLLTTSPNICTRQKGQTRPFRGPFSLWLFQRPLTYGYDEGHAQKLASQRPFDLIEEVIEGRSQMSEDEAEFSESSVEDIVVMLDNLVPMLLSILSSRGGQ